MCLGGFGALVSGLNYVKALFISRLPFTPVNYAGVGWHVSG